MSANHARSWPESSATGTVISTVVAVATALMIFTWHGAALAASGHPLDFAVFFVLTAALMLLAVDIYGRGSISVAGVAMLATGFSFGVGAAVFAGIFAATVHAVRRRSKPYKALFNAATFAIAAGAGADVYRLFPDTATPVYLLGPALLAGATFWLVNIGLLTAVMSLSQGIAPRRIFDEHFRWLTFHYLAFGPLALACTIAYAKVGLVGLFAFALPPALLIVSVQQYIRKTRASVAEIERANDELRRSNSDLRDLFEFAAGLTAQRHDSRSIADYAQTLTRAPDRRTRRNHRRQLPGRARGPRSPPPGRIVGDLRVTGSDQERWLRLQDAIEPQLATALESAILAEETRSTHLATIAALSRSLEAKDTYTGGHTERVADIAVALARRLGFDGPDLDAIEIGALLHDIGKIGIPEAILHKPGPLDDDEWTMMKRHPVISEFILSGADLHPIVLQIARSSHERIDGQRLPRRARRRRDPAAGADRPRRRCLRRDHDRPPLPRRAARAPRSTEIVAHSGDQFCPRVVTALQHIYEHEPALLGEQRLTVVA